MEVEFTRRVAGKEEPAVSASLEEALRLLSGLLSAAIDQVCVVRGGSAILYLEASPARGRYTVVDGPYREPFGSVAEALAYLRAALRHARGRWPAMEELSTPRGSFILRVMEPDAPAEQILRAQWRFPTLARLIDGVEIAVQSAISTSRPLRLDLQSRAGALAHLSWAPMGLFLIGPGQGVEEEFSFEAAAQTLEYLRNEGPSWATRLGIAAGLR